MPGNKNFKFLEKRLAELGYEYARSASRGTYWVYTRPGSAPISVNTALTENAARQIIRRAEKDLGILAAAPKRNPVAVKQRQAAEREQQAAELERLNAEREEISCRRQTEPLSRAEVAALERRVAEIEAERRRLERLMKAPTGGRSHADTRKVRHRAGKHPR